MESRASPRGRGEIEESREPAAASEERVHVAVGKEVRDGKNTLLWAVQNFHAPIVVTHVHRPATMIPLFGGKFPVSQTQEQVVEAFRQLEKEKMNKSIDEFLLLCSQQKVKSNKLVIEMDDVAKGLVELIAQYGITKLVMGAAADKYYSKKMKFPRSKTARTVKQLADPSCHIWFVCKGNLICTREICFSFGLTPSPVRSPTSQSSSSSISSSQSEKLRSRSSSEGKGGTLKHMQNLLWRRSTSQNRSSSENSSSHGLEALSDTPQSSLIQASSPLSCLGLDGSLAVYTREELSKRALPNSYPSSQSENDDVLSKSDFQSQSREEESEVDSVVPPGDVLDEDLNFLSPHNELEDAGVDLEVYHKLQNALAEVGNFKHQAYKESLKRQRAERDAFEAFQRVDVLSRVRHPYLVTVIGACPEAWALIYEYLPNGSLEDRLTCMSNSQPLTWQTRTRIAAEICSALIFLHSSNPHPVVHGDLKPENVLLDANLVSKLSDFGLCRSIVQSDAPTTLYRHAQEKGTSVYMEPEFLATGDLTPRSDVYSFGVIILRLLTGRHPRGTIKEVQDAIEKEALHGIIDPTAGDWPFVQAKQLAHLGLRCCQMNRKNRPDLPGEVWRVLEPMMKSASFSASQISFSSITEDNTHIPNYFICPIFQEVMRDPHIAADGFTYEAEALRGWIDSGHRTSPMTNLKLSHCELLPNRALRSAIQEWMQQQLTQF